MDNKGWFRLVWHESIEGDRRERDIETTKRVLHNTHCYIVGEISNYLLGRGLIENDSELKAYITREATCMFRLCLAGSGYRNV